MQTFKLAVCPHDTSKRLPDWIDFAVYLGGHLGIHLSLVQSMDFESFHASFPEISLAYANPLDALRLEEERGFVPVAGNDNYDEVVFVVAKGKEVEDLSGKRVGTVRDTLPTLLGVKALRDQGVTHFTLDYYDSWGVVALKVIEGAVDLGFLYKDFYDQLLPSTKEEFHVLFESQTRAFSHYFMVDPKEEDLARRLKEILLNPERELLQALGFSHFYEVASLEPLRQFVKEAKALLP